MSFLRHGAFLQHGAAGRNRLASVIIAVVAVGVVILGTFSSQFIGSATPVATPDAAARQAAAIPEMALAPEAAPAAASAAPCSPFPDVNSSNQHCQNIEWLLGVGITKPADGFYHSLDSVTRGSMAAFLFRLTHPGKAQPRCTGKPFPDVSTSYLFCGYIAWAKSNGIAYGYPGGKYGPNNAVTRGAMAAYLFRIANPGKGAKKCTHKPFKDVTTTETFCGVITWARSNGVTYGVGNGTNYGTTMPVTRQAMASFLRRVADSPGKVGDSFILSVDGDRAVEITLDRPQRIRPKSNKPAANKTLLSVRVTARAHKGITGTAAGSFRVDPSHWSVVGSNGHRYPAIRSGANAGSLHAKNLKAGAVVRGSIIFDAPKHGIVNVTPAGYDKIAWKY